MSIILAIYIIHLSPIIKCDVSNGSVVSEKIFEKILADDGRKVMAITLITLQVR
jgi:hypothetical protein